MLIDLHTHTQPLSYDSFLHPDDLIERSRKAGLDAVVLSEHDWAWEPEAVQALAKRHNYPVFAAIEINTEDGHMLAYGLHEYIYGMHRAHELAGHVERIDGVMVAAHPYRRQMPWRWDDEQEYLDALARAESNDAYRFVAGLEVLNGRGTLKENSFAQRLAAEMGMPGTGGTDSHQRTDIGKTATYFERDITTEQELIEEIRGGRFWAVDLTGGKLTEDPRRYAVPDDVDAAWAAEVELRRAREAADTPEFRNRPHGHPHVHAGQGSRSG
ncbi:MAG: PHP domain-containing protein [Dehalococcoidia bacterium]